MRLVTIDNGNTFPNVGFFDSGVLKGIVPLDQYVPEAGDFVLISNVGRPLSIKASYDLKKNRTATHFFDMKVQYSDTLGDDRLIASYGLYQKIKNNERILLIDAGTFITCDLITADGFQGGYILPGIGRFLKIYSDSARLPLLSKDLLFKKSEGLPHTTEDAILKATEFYLKATIDEVINATSPDKIVFTGGSARDIKKLINLEVHSELDLHLIHSALSSIHQHHLSQE